MTDRQVTWGIVGLGLFLIILSSTCTSRSTYERPPEQIGRPVEIPSHDTIKPIPPTLEPRLPLSFDDVYLSCRNSQQVKLVRFLDEVMIQIPGNYLIETVYRYESVRSQLSGSRAVTRQPTEITVLKNVRLSINVVVERKPGQFSYESTTLYNGIFQFRKPDYILSYWPITPWLRDRLLRGKTFDFQDTRLNTRIICDIRRKA